MKIPYSFIEAIPADDGEGWLAVVVDGNGLGRYIIDNYFYTKAEAEKEGGEFQALIVEGYEEAQHEAAAEAGMLGGVDAYNEIMGY